MQKKTACFNGKLLLKKEILQQLNAMQSVHIKGGYNVNIQGDTKKCTGITDCIENTDWL